MRRFGVVVLSPDCAAKPFIDDLVSEADGGLEALWISSARTCVAIMNCSLRRRLLIVDGPPVDLSFGALLEAVRLNDPGLSIVFVRDGWTGTGESRDRVRAVPGPLVSAAAATAIIDAYRSAS